VNGEPTRRRAAGGESWTSGAYAEATLDLGRTTLTGGARLDHWSISNGHLFQQMIATGEVLTDEHDPGRGGWLPTARAGISTPVAGGLSVRTAAYLGWRMPTLNELFRPFRAGLDATAANPDLKPEKLAGVEAGFDYRAQSLDLKLTAFSNRLKDAIANVTLGKGPGLFPDVGFVASGGTFYQRENVDAVNVRGLEASADWTQGVWFISAGASLTHARMEGSRAAAFLDGLRPAETPNFSATLALGWHDGARGAQLVLRRIGAQFDNDLNTDLLKPATTLSLYASWPLSKRLQLVARGENVTNTLVMAAINGDGSIERATPRTVWIGLRLR
jgi:outer membrane receptor protein involved in Fe transport